VFSSSLLSSYNLSACRLTTERRMPNYCIQFCWYLNLLNPSPFVTFNYSLTTGLLWPSHLVSLYYLVRLGKCSASNVMCDRLPNMFFLTEGMIQRYMESFRNKFYKFMRHSCLRLKAKYRGIFPIIYACYFSFIESNNERTKSQLSWWNTAG
jgi:hypothetical protein